ncbi:MAG TPA: hypothetical protein VNO30_46620 [Kofleriaceae bacterium]|nr:hypothetical protein [Kofleriaceae bacterium]
MRLTIASFTALALVVGACTDDMAPMAEPEPEPGLAIRITATIPPGSEAEYCKFVTVPETWVTKDYIEYTPGSHHAGVMQTPYTSIPTQKEDGTPVDTSGVFDCSEGVLSSWRFTKIVGGSVNAGAASILAFPDGVGMRIGGVLLMNAHYRNGSDAPLVADVQISFDTTTADQIVYEGDLLGIYNPLIAVPARGTARARMRCPIYRDITIATTQSHMHERGVGFRASINDQAPYYVHDRWQDVPVGYYESLHAKAGSVLDFSCDYRNTEDRRVYMGLRTTDEMCVVTGTYYPADPRISSCLDETGKVFGGDWIGEGTATCQQTMDCLAQAQGLSATADCMLAASPAVSHESSEVFRCFLRAQEPELECGLQIQACAAR